MGGVSTTMEVNSIPPDNGFTLNSYFIPEEVLIHVLSFVDPRSLILQCRLVCKAWRDIIDDNQIWKLMMVRSDLKSLSKFPTCKRKQLAANFPWYLNYWILRNVRFEQNLLRNNCGEQKLKHWCVMEPQHKPPSNLGDRFWDVEPLPCFSDPLPSDDDFQGNKCCFSTSYVNCRKRQRINLLEEGFPAKLLDEFQPPITVSEWYAGRYDCGCRYTLRLILMNENHQTIVPVEEAHRSRTQWQGREWNKVTLTFENYGPGLRYIIFEHEGKDTQFWAGNYGSKMAGGVVKICFPKILPSTD